jgi:hypothetical protein
MASLANTVFDNGLSQIASGGLVENLYITSAEATTFAQASDTLKLGTKATPTMSAVADRSGGGREVVVSAISDGAVNGTDSATHWALTDDSGSLLLATGSLSSPQSVTNGNTFTLTSFAIGFADPT